MKRYFFIFIVLWCAGFLQASPVSPRASLSLTDAYGNTVSSLIAGVPGRLIITVDGNTQTMALPDTPGEVLRNMPGLEKFERGAVQTSMSHMNINGVSSVQQQLIMPIRADHPGTYTLGPVEIPVGGTIVRSNSLIVTVQPASSSASAQSTKEEPLSIKLVVDKDTVVVGEPVQLTISLLREPDVRLTAPLFLDVEKQGFVMDASSPPKEFQALRSGHVYHGTEHTITLYADKPGVFTIPALTAQGLLPRRAQDYDLFSIADFFGRAGRPYTAHSNSCSIEVLPLPPTHHPVQAIGSITSFTARLRTHTAKVGQGVELLLEIEGSGNASRVVLPLPHVPPGLTAYYSKSDIVAQPEGWKKTFEYIVQGASAGTFIIPEQSLHYFDVQTKKYATVATKPLSLELEPNAHLPQPVRERVNEIDHEQQTEEKSIMTAASPATTTYSYALSWFYFFAALSGIALLSTVISARRQLRDYQQRARPYRAFSDARAALARARKEHDEAALYGILMRMFAQRYALDGVITELDCLKIVHAAGMPHETITRWHHDISLLSQAAYGTHVKSGHDLFEKTQYWIAEMEKVLT